MAKVSLKRVRLNSGGYEYGRYGKYYGNGQPLFRADLGEINENIPEDILEFRADNRESAKSYLLKHYPGITFYR